MRSSRVFDTSASAELLTASSPSSTSRNPGESASYAAYMLANIVSPPNGGSSRASSIVAIGGCSRYTVSLCQIPPKFTVSCGSLATSMISGWVSNPLTNG